VRRAAARDGRIKLIQRHRGPGRRCLRGAASRAGIEWLLTNTAHRAFVDFDADGANRVDELLVGYEALDSLRADVVIASKYVRGSRVLDRPIVRRLGSRAYNLLLRSLMSRAIRDYSNSFRFYTRSAAQLLLEFRPRYETPLYLVEMMAVWLSSDLRIVEIPTVYGRRIGGSSKVGPGDLVRGVTGALDVGIRYRLGRYRPVHAVQRR